MFSGMHVHLAPRWLAGRLLLLLLLLLLLCILPFGGGLGY